MMGTEWVVEAYGCDSVRLASVEAMQGVFGAMIAELALHPVGHAQWHQFPAPGGITGMLLLAESHLTIHTFPEHRSLCINLFCCTARNPWQWHARLAELVGADDVRVRTLVREYGPRSTNEAIGGSVNGSAAPASDIPRIAAAV